MTLFDVSSLRFSRLLLMSFLWVCGTAQAEDCPKPDLVSPVTLSGSDLQKDMFSDGVQVRLECEVGYTEGGGSRVITCNAGTWSPTRLICQRKSCGSPGEIENGYFDITGTEFGDKAVAICNTGFQLVGKGQRSCMAQGWSGRIPQCEVVTCEPPAEASQSVTYSPSREVYSYREVVQYRCLNSDYTMNGSDSITCTENGTFRPAPPICIMVECKTPDIPHSIWESGARPPYKYKSFVMFKCKSGYNMIGSSTITCDINSEWSPGLPKCEKIVQPTTKAATTTTTTTPPTSSTKEVPGAVTPTPKTPTPTSSKGIWIAVGVLSPIVIVVLGWFCYRQTKNRKNRTLHDDGPL